MTRLALGFCILLPALCADVSKPDPELSRVLKGVEDRYNHAKTLQVSFEESYSVGGRSGKPENGTLSLRKPGRMRWDYRNPPGKLFVSDSKDVYLYTPSSNRVEKMKLKESEDMRAPLAFLLGKLEFEKDFEGFVSKKGQNGEVSITAKPKSDRLPYRQVEFVLSPALEIHKLDVLGDDSSVLSFVFSNERMNPSLSDRMFQFQMPPGATLVDAGNQRDESK